MSDAIAKGEITRLPVTYDEERRAVRIWGAACVRVHYAAPMPFSTLGYTLTATDALAFLLRQADMPLWRIGSFMRLTDAEIRACLAQVDQALRDPVWSEWLGALRQGMPCYVAAEPKPDQPEFAGAAA